MVVDTLYKEGLDRDLSLLHINEFEEGFSI